MPTHRWEPSQARNARRPPPIIVTTPRKSISSSYLVSTHFRLAWAKDEPPSNEEIPLSEGVQGRGLRTSEAHCHISSISEIPSQWWVFNDRIVEPVGSSSPQSKRRSLRDIALAWVPSSVVWKNTSSFTREGGDMDRENASPQSTTSKQPAERCTTPHTMTPRLNTSWTAKLEPPGPSCRPERNDRKSHNRLSGKNALRSFILTNVYVPLVCRCRSHQFHILCQQHPTF
jgi:hypothetical protein